MTPSRLQELGLQRLDLLCAFMHYALGQDSLAHAPVLLMGYHAIGDAPPLAAQRHALIHLRRCCQGLGTLAALRAAAARYNDLLATSAEHPARFTINEKTLVFKPVYDQITEPLRLALAELSQPGAPILHTHALGQNATPAYLRLDHGGEQRRYRIEGIPAQLPVPAQHAERKTARPPSFEIAWRDLLQEAEQMDAIDREQAVARPGNWRARLEATALTVPMADGGLTEASSLELAGLKHLIGLPGAGKTTLLVCLLRYLGSRQVKTAVFFPSVEVCRQYLEYLQRYGVCAGLLVGQSADTKQRHAFKLGEALASTDVLGGFGRSVQSAGLFEGVCALPRLTAAPPAAFSVEDQFCHAYWQAIGEAPKSQGRMQAHLCPAWSLCSRNRAARELPNAIVWLGHVRSADTEVPAHTTVFAERYFERIARTFDLVIFDEADSAQQTLDMMGVSQLKLSGYPQSFHQSVQEASLRLIAKGGNARLQDSGFAQFSIECAEFEKLNIMLLTAVHRLDDTLRQDLSGLLLTPLRLIGDWLTPRRRSALSADAAIRDLRARAKEALSHVWEDAAISAFQRRSAQARAPNRNTDAWRRRAAALERPLDQLAQDADTLQAAMVMWINAGSANDRADQEARIEAVLAPYLRTIEPGPLSLLVRLLIAVTFTVLCYRRLSFRLDMLAMKGVVEPVQLNDRCSDALLAACPDNLLGSLSGVRFFTGQRGQAGRPDDHGVQLQYIVFAGAPRGLMYRLHRWNAASADAYAGPAVLLTSATSYLPDSPAFHVDAAPDYLLRQRSPSTPAMASLYRFLPLPDPDDPGRGPLRFSGVRSERTRVVNLQKMAAALLEGGPTGSWVGQHCASFDRRHGLARKAAFVVNSYDQCLALKRFIDQRFPSWRERTVAVVRQLPLDGGSQGLVTASMVEALGDDPGWNLLIFPMGALGRGTNIVFSQGPRQRDATLGTLYFLTRPHPSPDDLGFLVSLGGRATMDFDTRAGTSLETLEDCTATLRRARAALYRDAGYLLRHPLYARSLRADLFTRFTANVAVPLLQTIGRGMRNGCPVQCVFVDRAWAENSSIGQIDSPQTSMLVQLRAILERGCVSHDPRHARLFRELYGAFLEPFRQVEGLISQLDQEAMHEPELDLPLPPLWADFSPIDDEEN